MVKRVHEQIGRNVADVDPHSPTYTKGYQDGRADQKERAIELLELEDLSSNPQLIREFIKHLKAKLQAKL